MKFKFNYLLTAALVCGLSLAATSCKDDNDDADDNASVVEIDKDITAHGVETDMQSAVLEVPVKCDGHWTATLPKGTTWARILEWQVSYEGAKTIRIAIDENRTGVDRRTKLCIGNSDGELTKIDVVQYYNFEGQPPTNGSGQAFSDKGLGTGLDYDYALNVKLKTNPDEQFEPTKVHGLNNLFNISVIEDLIKRGKLQKSAYVETVIPVAQLEAALMDSSVVQNKTLDVALTLGVQFGPVSFEGHGEYSSVKQESRAIVDYTIVRNCPMYNAYLSPAELTSYANNPANNHLDEEGIDAAYAQIEAEIAEYVKINKRSRRKLEVNEEGLTAEQAEIIDNMWDAIEFAYDYAGIFSSAFTDRQNDLYNAITRRIRANRPIDTEKADAALNTLDNNYGPFFIAGGDYGGNLVMHCEIDTMYLNGQTTFGGELSAEFAGMFEVEGEFHYTEEGYDLLRKSNTKINIVGGNANDTADDMLKCVTGGNATDLSKWQGLMRDWIASMYSPTFDSPNQSQAAPISYIVCPIWTLFSDPQVQQYAQEYFMKKYANRGIYSYFGIINGDIHPGANETLNTSSDFWNNK